MRLRRPLYGVEDAFAMDADDQFRKNGMLRYFISLWITWKKEKKRKWILYNNDKG